MKTIVLTAFLMILAGNAYADIQLTDDQFKNIDILDAALRKKDANFIGLNGSRDNMKVIGISEEEAKKVIDKLDIQKAKKDKEDADPKTALKKSGLQKLKTVAGLTDDELKALNLLRVDQ